MKKPSLASLFSLITSGAMVAGISSACGGSSAPGGFAPGSSDAGNQDGSSGPGTLGGGDGGGGAFSEGGVSGGDAAFQGCATGEAGASREPVYLLFILDGSGSMNDNNKWVAATGAIDAIFTDMQTKADPGMGAGLIVFSDSNDTGGGAYPSSSDVPIAFVDAAQAAKLIGRTASPDRPQRGTPTGSALTGGYGELASFQGASPLLPGGKKVLVLITDGVPTDNCATLGQGSSSPSNPCIDMAKTELGTATPNGPIETFVIGVGSLPGDTYSFDPSFLGGLAVAGGSGPAGCNPEEKTSGAADFCYFNVDPSGSSLATQTAFETAINNIRGQVSSCTLAIAATGSGAIDPKKVNVVLDGSTVPQDPTNGWTYDDPQKPTSVTLHGTACDTLKNDPAAKVSILLGCATQGPK